MLSGGKKRPEGNGVYCLTNQNEQFPYTDVCSFYLCKSAGHVRGVLKRLVQ